MHYIATFLGNCLFSVVSITFIPKSSIGILNTIAAAIMFIFCIAILLHFVFIIKVANRITMEFKHLGFDNNLKEAKLDNPILFFKKEPIKYIMFRFYLP